VWTFLSSNRYLSI